MIYLDSTATTKPTVEALDTFVDVSLDNWHNPNSTMYECGIVARRLVTAAREKIAECVGAQPEQIIFTSGSTEAANAVIQGFVPRGYEKNYAIICSPIEHPAVYETVRYMERCGVAVSFLKCESDGFVDLTHLDQLLDKYKYMDGTLVCVMDSNNEIGTIQETKVISRITHLYPRAKLFCDMTQSYAHARKYRADELEYDFACGSAQKFGGLKGVGFFYAKDRSSISPLIYGGGQEFGMRAGTENVAGICSMADTFVTSCANRKAQLGATTYLKTIVVSGVKDMGGIVISPDYGLPNIVSVLFKGVSANDVIAMMDLKGIMLSAGSACSTGHMKPSRILKAIGLSDEDAASVLRISLDGSLSIEDVNVFLTELKGVIDCLSME